MRWRFPQVRFRVGTMLGLIAAVALGLGAWKAYDSPEWRWRRALHEDVMWFSADPLQKLMTTEGTIIGLGVEKSLAEVERTLTDDHPHVRELGLLALDRLPIEPGRMIDLTAPLLVDPDPSVRRWAGHSLAFLNRYKGSDRARIMGLLLGRLEDDDPTIRSALLFEIQEVVDEANRPDSTEFDPETLARIVAGFETRTLDPDRTVRIGAAAVLARHGRGEKAIPLLIEDARRAEVWTPEPYFVCPSVSALTVLAARSDEAALALISMMDPKAHYLGPACGPRESLREAAGRGSAARSRVARLATEALRSESFFVRANAAILLAQIGQGERAVRQLIEAVRNAPDLRDGKTYRVDLDAIDALGIVGPFDPEVVPILQDARIDGDPDARSRAKTILDRWRTSGAIPRDSTP